MKPCLSALLCTAILCLFSLAGAGDSLPAKIPDQALDSTIAAAMTELKAVKGDPGLLILTNAPYVRTRGRDSLAPLARAQELTGAAVGKGNLLFFQRPQGHPLCMMLFKKSDRRAVVITGKGEGWAVDRLDLSAPAISDPQFWKTAGKTHAAGRDLFTLAAIATAWAEGVPYDFLKAAELHNHICPGVTSGYLLAHYIREHYPLTQGQGYTILASPVWCKEDAFQVILDCTPGKRGLVVKPLSEDQKQQITVPNPAGFLLVWNAKTKTGKGVALSFDFTRLKALYPENTPKAATILYTAPFLEDPDQFVSVSKEFPLDHAMYSAMKQAGSNPYQIAGLIKP